MHGIKMGVLPSDEISNTEPVAPVVGNRMAYFGPQQGARELRFIFPGRHTSISHLRTTLTLDEDVAAKLREETRRRNTSFKETVNACLRRGLEAPTDRSWQGHSASSRGGWVCEPESTSTTSGACWIFSTVRPADDARRHQPAALCLRRGQSAARSGATVVDLCTLVGPPGSSGADQRAGVRAHRVGSQGRDQPAASNTPPISNVSPFSNADRACAPRRKTPCST